MTGLHPGHRGEAVIFLHIPKSAGTTIYKILENQYSKAESYLLDGSRTPQAILEFKSLPTEKKNGIRLLYGHQTFGLHRQLPGKARYFTLLRDPIERIASHYYYVLRSRSHYLHDQVTRKKLTLKEYVASGISKELNDAQVRFISGIGFHFGFAQCPADLLELAEIILDEFFVMTGLIEYFDETVLMLKKVLDWKAPFYFKHNVSDQRPGREMIDADTLETIRHYNRLDLDLYLHASRNFKARLDGMGLSFQNELKAFRRLIAHWRKFKKKMDSRDGIPSKSLRNQIIGDLKGIQASLLAAGEDETADWLIQYASEMYPGEEEIRRSLTQRP